MAEDTSFPYPVEWSFDEETWKKFIDIERKNKQEDNLYMAIGVVILGALSIFLFRNSTWWVGLAFSIPLAVVMYFGRMTVSMNKLKAGLKRPIVYIDQEYLIYGGEAKVDLANNDRWVRGASIKPAGELQLLELDVWWLTRKGPTSDEFRFPIPPDQMDKAQEIVDFFNGLQKRQLS